MPIGTIPPPIAAITEQPMVSICVNKNWIPVIHAMIAPARFPEFWGGTLDENRFARANVRQLMKILQQTEECGMSECCHDTFAPIYTFDPLTTDISVSYDGGATTQQWPQDPRLGGLQFPPPVGTVKSSKCDAANACIVGLKQYHEQTLTICSGAPSLPALLASIASLLETELVGGAIGILAAIVTIIAGAIWAIGCEQWNALYSDENWHKLQCMIYCHMSSGGQLSQQAFYDLCVDVRSHMPGTGDPLGAAENFFYMLASLGRIMLNSFAYTQVAENDADCSDCDCHVCGSDWTRWQYGTQTGAGIHPDGTLITDAAIDVSGGQYYIYTAEPTGLTAPLFAVTLKSPDIAACCRVFWEVLSGGAVTPAFIGCNEAQDPAGYHFSELQGTRANAQEFASASSFTIRVTFLG